MHKYAVCYDPYLCQIGYLSTVSTVLFSGDLTTTTRNPPELRRCFCEYKYDVHSQVLINKTPIFIPGVRYTRKFLAWLREPCLGGLTAQLNAEKLMVVPSTAKGFRTVVSALQSLDGGEGVSFHTFTLPEDRCVRLLVKNVGRGMPESVVREKMESLGIHV